MRIDKSRLNLIEGTISSEHQKDAGIIRNVLKKLLNRSNARLTPEEENILKKYDLAKSDNHGLLAADIRGQYTIPLSLKNSRFASRIANKSFDLIDYIEKQRERQVQRQYFSDGSRKPSSGYFDSKGKYVYDPSGAAMIATYKDNAGVVAQKKHAVNRLSKVNDEYDKACMRAAEEYEKALKRAFHQLSFEMGYYQKQLDQAQDIIDTRLKKK